MPEDRSRRVPTPGDPYLHDYFRRFRSDIGDVQEPGTTRRRYCFLIGSTAISGGTYVILQHAEYARERGDEVVLVPVRHDPNQVPWHPALQDATIATYDDIADEVFDVAIATWWPTVYELPRVRCRHALYLVQSVESRFYGMNEDEAWAPALAELTYTFDIPVITIAQWLQIYLAFRHRRPSFLVRNGIRKDLYQPVGPAVESRVPGRLRVLVEGTVDVPMKNVKRSIALAREGGADEVWLLTPSACGALPGVDRVFSQVAVDETPPIYRSCDTLLKLSMVEGMYGPPLEMFHCGGTAVTYDVTGHEEYVEHDRNALVVPTGDEDGVRAAIRRLCDEPGTVQRLRSEALRTAWNWPDWHASSASFYAYLRAIARQPARDHLQTMLAIAGGRADFPGGRI